MSRASTLACLLVVALAEPVSAQADEPVCSPDKAAESSAVDSRQRVLDAIKCYQQFDLSRKSGQAHGLALDMAVETIQILGEIVVDRATAEAYRLIEEKVADALSCGESPIFTATCGVITSIRIADLASTPAALRTALLADATRMVMEEIEKLPKELPGIDHYGLYAVLLRDIVVPGISHAGGFDRSLAASVVHHVIQYGLDRQTENLCGLQAEKAALIVAGLTAAACEGSGQGDKCPLPAIVQTFKCGDAPRWFHVAARARSLAAKMLVALHAESGPKKVDLRARIRAALEVIFDDLCAQSDPTLGCQGEGDVTRRVRTLRSIALGALDGDTNSIVSAVISHLKHELELEAERRKEPKKPGGAVTTDDETRDKKEQMPRGLRIVAALLDYASTYVPEKAGSGDGEDEAAIAKAAHEKRKKILESLTAEMTNRTERGGDGIFSAGGSLRGVFGARVRDGGDNAYWTPLQLTLGFAFDVVGENHPAGLHLEIGVLDLGQYVSLDQDEEVREPDLADSLAPSATVALSLGRSLPFVIGVTGAFAPQYEYEDGKRGAWSIGGTAGIYVPLFDIN